LGRPGFVVAAAHLREVGRAEPVDHRLHAARPVEGTVLALELLDVARRAEERDQVTAGRRTPDANAVWVEVVCPGVGPQPADGGLAVFELRWEDGVPAEAIVDARHCITLAGKRQGRPPALL